MLKKAKLKKSELKKAELKEAGGFPSVFFTKYMNMIKYICLYKHFTSAERRKII